LEDTADAISQAHVALEKIGHPSLKYILNHLVGRPLGPVRSHWTFDGKRLFSMQSLFILLFRGIVSERISTTDSQITSEPLGIVLELKESIVNLPEESSFCSIPPNPVQIDLHSFLVQYIGALSK
jgi:hypothetical protein